MKNIEINEVNEFLISEYVYLPYTNKEDLIITSDKSIYKNSAVSLYNNSKIYSPVSGKIYGLSEIASIDGLKSVLIVENDFKDNEEKKKLSNKDIYKLNKEVIKEALMIDSNTVALRINKKSNNDKIDSYILRDYVKIVLETLNLIDTVYPNVKVKIVLDKKDITSYQILFSHIGTYPNIDIEFSTKNNYRYYSIYEIIDIYNILKNSVVRDYIYVNFIYKKESFVVKCKKYTNLSEILNNFEICPDKIMVNEKVQIANPHYLLDENIYLINVI